MENQVKDNRTGANVSRARDATYRFLSFKPLIKRMNKLYEILSNMEKLELELSWKISVKAFQNGSTNMHALKRQC